MDKESSLHPVALHLSNLFASVFYKCSVLVTKTPLQLGGQLVR